MGQPILGDCILERARDVRLANEIVEGLGAILSGEDLVAHKITLNALRDGRK